ncbi:hypothetical protein ACP4OV_000193 [Aristida adscensionis]
MGDAPAAAAAAAASSPGRKRRRGSGDEGGGELRRVAEIVMVLAAAGEVRGGRAPTAAERALAAEARERLAAAVAGGAVRPRDLFPGEAVRAVVEDLGLNRAKDPAAMGFRPPKASIADRLMLTKRKGRKPEQLGHSSDMEEVKEPPAPPTTSTPQTSGSSGMSDFQGLHGASKFGIGAPRNPPGSAAMAATVPLTSTSLVTLKPPGSSPVKQVMNSSVAALPHTGPPHLKPEKDVNGPLNLARSGATIVHSNKSTQDASARSNVNAVQSSNQMVKNQDTKPVAIHAATGNPVAGHRATPGMAFVPPKPTFANHNEIAKLVQQFLYQPINHPSWTPPSTEYMQARLGCQICKAAIMDADSLLVCDACERGVHLKCLQHYGNKGVPKAEWHCSACLTQSKGKPLPPKYGKVTRTVVSSKAAPPGGGAQLPSQVSAENRTAKSNHQKLSANGNLMKSISTQAGSTVHNSNVLALTAATAGSQSQLVSTLRPSMGNSVKTEASSNEKEGTGQPCSGPTQNNVISLPNKRLSSGLSLNSLDSANDVMHGKQTTENSGGMQPGISFAGSAEAKIKSETHSEPLPSGVEEIVDTSGTSMKQTRTIATEEKPSTQSTYKRDKVEDVEMITNNETSTDQGSNFATEEKLHSEATSEPHTINNVEMTANTVIAMQQSSRAATVEKFQNVAASEPHTIQDVEMGVNTPAPGDQSSNVTEEKPQSGLKTNQMETDQTQLANGLTENGVKASPNGEACEDKPCYNADSDHGGTQVATNGVLRPRDEKICVNEDEAMFASTEAKEAN